MKTSNLLLGLQNWAYKLITRKEFQGVCDIPYSDFVYLRFNRASVYSKVSFDLVLVIIQTKSLTSFFNTIT
jgi:hypothetical protein